MMRSHYITKALIVLTLITISSTGTDLCAQADTSKNPVGEELFNVTLELPETSGHKSYLGIDGNSFQVSDIHAEVVVVEIFSMYCPHCQKDAPNMNAFFSLLKQSELYKDKIKLIGIGVGNSLFEVDFFRKTYSIEFPMFPDPDFAIHKLLGGVRTPYFIGIRKLKDGSARIFMSESGGGREPEAFLEQIIEKSELE